MKRLSKSIVPILSVWLLCHSYASAVDFTNDIAPIFTKFGCNGGACHGKSSGRGGFKLSLFGFDPRSDFLSITRQSRGRRVFPAAPDKSLLLMKATMSVAHGGGRRLTTSQPEYQKLRNWIQSSMPWKQGPSKQITRLVITPKLQQAARNSTRELKATAFYSDGSNRDVTRVTRFKSNDTAIATVGQFGKVTTTDQFGQTAIVGLYQGKVSVSRILVPIPKLTANQTQRLKQYPINNFIDRHVQTKLTQLQIPPAGSCSDAKFIRRATLQICGRMPTLEELKQFTADPSRNKRSQLIDRLLASSQYADNFAQKWCDILRIKRRGQRPRIPGTMAFHRWVRNALAKNKPYDQFVREIITATGNVSVTPTAQWYAEVRYLDRYVDDTAQAFLGIRIGCARCHHHPFEQYSQGDYYGLAAFFARVARKGGAGVAERRANETVYVKASGSVKHPQTRKVVLPKGLGGKPLKIPAYVDPRQKLVDWMSQPKNPYFAKAFVNRMWAHFFGRGLVDPIDDMRVTNPPSNAPLLDALAQEFVRSKYNMKHIVRLMCNSHTYELKSFASGPALADTSAHARFYPQRLTAEVLLDCIDHVTGLPTSYSGLPKGTTAVQLPDEGYSNEFLRLFGRPQRESACECERTTEPSLSQSLYVRNNRFVLNKVDSARGYARKLVTRKIMDKERIRLMWVRCLCRDPDDKELQHALKYIREESDPKVGYSNLLWALINTKEFLFVH